MKKRRKNSLAGLILFLAGFLILSYPFFSNLWNEYRGLRLIARHEAEVQDLSKEECDRMLTLAKEYNDIHRENVFSEAFIDDDYVLTHPYDTLLSTRDDGLMGSIEIPSINVYLPIYHGTSSSVLAKGAGHLPGTSLPIGGKGTHAVISAHTGFPSAKMFTDLDRVKEGDLFYVHVLRDVYAYKVDRITSVLPSEPDLLAIDPEIDQVTLLTCTPYGINTHRLLVRGMRTEIPEGYYSDSIAKKKIIRIILTGLVLVLAFCLMAVVMLIMKKRSKRNKDEKFRKRVSGNKD